MKWAKWLENWDMTSLKINMKFLEMEWNPQEKDKDAAWELYIELLTRITTQPLIKDVGDEKSALESINSIFKLTRDILKKYGRDCSEFAKIAIVILNQILRPFSAKWHKFDIEKLRDNKDMCSKFREELQNIQEVLCTYTQMLSQMAGVEDFTKLEDVQ